MNAKDEVFLINEILVCIQSGEHLVVVFDQVSGRNV